eukprot:CAMPEP_0178746152 /NCGR_PEP_ID=MMETSP0744-20121128/7662_1 /TAXON_ID=913974 /ORGANISM="Nitzschia punctata, Strain CCMP561" /LENGTH=807 /DNA_ID=CAMNT_0020399355 /DNA_START=377 /DNA_END=2800 /DNA_ORIENTATION=-
MDDVFEEWVRDTAQKECISKWADALIRLGASWESFRRDEDEIVNDFVQVGGIPLLAARDIVKVAKEEIERSHAPMAIFWDLENMPIPENCSGRDVTTRLKSILSPYGNLVQFRAYASIGLNLIPQQKRSDLQLSGCHLVDCPHNGRKEVADKMIIVDAMQFAFLNPNGATLCFVTGDVDYAYLLAVLQRPKWRTIVISKGTMSSMLHVNCDMRMRWETDILQACVPVISSVATPQELVQVRNESGSMVASPSKSGDSDVQNENSRPDHDEQSVLVRLDEDARYDEKATANTKTHPISSTEPPITNNSDISEPLPDVRLQIDFLTAKQQWTDEIELLRNLLHSNGSGPLHNARKSLIGNLLRTTNPARFYDRAVVRTFLARCIEDGIVSESGEGTFKTLGLPPSTLPRSISQSSKPIIQTCHSLPGHLAKEITERVRTLSNQMPYVLFAPKQRIPSGTTTPKKTFVQHSKGYLLLMFTSLSDVRRVVEEELPQLSDCTLVDLRKCLMSSPDDNACNTKQLLPVQQCHYCTTCRRPLEETEVIHQRNPLLTGDSTNDACCSECYQWRDDEKELACDRIVSLLTMMAENDDISVARTILRKQLWLRYPSECSTRKHADLWIQASLNCSKTVMFKKEKNKQICLPSLLAVAQEVFPPETLDTSTEEKHVVTLLWDSDKPVSRKDVIESLKQTFPKMNSPFIRSRVFINGRANNHFFVAKGPYCQAVGLTEEDAQASLDVLTSDLQQDEKRSLVSSDSASTSKDILHEALDDQTVESFLKSEGCESDETTENYSVKEELDAHELVVSNPFAL